MWTALLKYILYVPEPCIKEYLHLHSKSVLLCCISVNSETNFGTKQPRSHYTPYKQNVRLDRLWGQPSLMFSVYRGSSTSIKWSGREVYHSHLVPRLRIGVAIPLLSLYVFLAWTGKTFYLYVTALRLFCQSLNVDAFQDISSTQKLSMRAISSPSQRLCPAHRTLQISMS
jgi:hypothetical protein